MLSILFHQAIDGEEVSDANIAASLTGSDTPGSEVTISYKRRGSVPKDLVLTRMPAGTFSDRKKQRASDDIDELLEVLDWGLGQESQCCQLSSRPRRATYGVRHMAQPPQACDIWPPQACDMRPLGPVQTSSFKPSRVRLLYMTTYFYKIKTLRCYIV